MSLFDLPADPFGIKEAEWAVWSAFEQSSVMEELLARQNAERASKERGIILQRLDRNYNGKPRSLWCCTTLHYFLNNANSSVDGVHAALAIWRECFKQRNSFLTGKCHEFALVAHVHLGWPIKLNMCSEDGPPELAGRLIHAVLEAPDGRLFDIEGFKSPEALERVIEHRALRTVEIDEFLEIINDLDSGLSPIEDLTEARSVLATVLGINLEDIADTSCLSRNFTGSKINRKSIKLDRVEENENKIQPSRR